MWCNGGWIPHIFTPGTRRGGGHYHISGKKSWCLLNKRLGCPWSQSGCCIEGKNSYIYQELNIGSIASYLADWEILAHLILWKTRDFSCRMKYFLLKDLIISEATFKNGMSHNMHNYFWITVQILLIKQWKNSTTIMYIYVMMIIEWHMSTALSFIFWFSTKASTPWHYVI